MNLYPNWFRQPGQNSPNRCTWQVPEGAVAYWIPNGYQSWTETHAYTPNDSIAPLHPVGWLLMTAYGDYALYSPPGQPGHLHGYSWIVARLNTGEWVLWASRDEQKGFTRFRVEPGRLIAEREHPSKTALQLGTYTAQSLQEVFRQWAQETGLQSAQSPPLTGFTSWYNYYTNISESLLLDVLAGYQARQVPIDVFQIDDGWQPQVGDWLTTKSTFPQGMRPIRDAIHAAGYRAGLWLAPFICTHRSSVYREHPDWLLHDARGRKVIAGYNPGWTGWLRGWFYALDWRKPAVQAHLEEVFAQAVQRWGFGFLKLDFLYAAALGLEPGETPGERMHQASQLLRKWAGPETTLLGCGVPLASVAGVMEYCRIGGDISLGWDDPLLQGLHYRERVDTHSSLRNTLCRVGLNPIAFGNDPDVFILRKENQRLTPTEQHTLLLTNHLAGQLVFCSDDVRQYDEGTWQVYRALFPHRSKEILQWDCEEDLYRVAFRLKDPSGLELEYWACINLSARERRVLIPPGLWFHAETGGWDAAGDEVRLLPHESRVWLNAHNPHLGGSTGHLFPGAEVEQIAWHNSETATVTLHPKAARTGQLWLKVQDESPARVQVNGTTYLTTLSCGQRLVVVNADQL